MTDKEIVKLFREGLGIGQLSDKEWIEQKEARKGRQESYQKECAYIKRMKSKDKKFKMQSRVVVGKPCTRFMALSIVERAIYNFLMEESKGGK